MPRRSVVKKNRTNIKTVSQKIERNKRIVGFMVAVLICVMGLLYISTVNSITTKSYQLESYRERLFSLQRENQKMAIEIADLKAMNNFENESYRFYAINREDVTYIVSGSTAIAME